MSRTPQRVRIPDLHRKKKLGQKITMLTAYDATMARLLDRAGVDMLLVGDSLGMVILGHDTTVPVTLDAMVHHARAVSRGAERAFVVADMPFLTWQASQAEAIRNAGTTDAGRRRFFGEDGRRTARADTVRRLVEIGIPVMAHIGLVPQAVHQLGGYRDGGAHAETRRTGWWKMRWRWNRRARSRIVLECIPRRSGRGRDRQAGHSHHRHWRGSALRRTSAGELRCVRLV